MHLIRDYYDSLAKDYDRDRFGNSYGRYVDAMERKILCGWLGATPPGEVIDIACGTGRFLDFSMTGVDISQEMLTVAAGKYPDRHLIQTGLPGLEAVEGSFKAAMCFHVFMHFDEKLIKESLGGIARVVEAGGVLIMDIPSKHRRELGRRVSSESGWHGNTSATRADLERWAELHWRIIRRRGILFFPIHRFPSAIRPFFRKLDELIGRTPLARFSSYLIYQLERRQ